MIARNQKWDVANSGGKVIAAGMGHPEPICVLETVPLKITPEVHSRAILIAKAPDMLRELEALVFLEKTAMSKSQVKMCISRAKDLLTEMVDMEV